ncbi:hypothetical protein AB1Y20_020579 [Prymnesium parvum]|uniref:NADH dehydrogenase [ubiquinone] 1 alpha subcomplex subunit 7 n=1 Tax=Prymnesium parvum TaxID=97485 RepID=A0AB34JUZ7_PRYPA|mmetsp:Transcript_11423/g.28262  ORF Transcript_11423/g.28262 Transcript_11423/m.28262 type:complete len:149 (-) Transcript_11423:338-784(-)
MPLKAWADYVWARLSRLDYWNPSHIPTNIPARIYRPHSPGFTLSREGKPPLVQQAEPGNIYNIRYFPRDYKRRDVGYYEDTPLSLNHALMKDKPKRPDDAPRSTIPNPPAFRLGAETKAEYGTPGSYGMRSTKKWVDVKSQKYEYELW